MSRKPYSRKVQKLGGSLAVTLPADVVDDHEIEQGDELQMGADPETGEVSYSPGGK